MTCGIYKLIFAGTDKVYIGQSIDIESRFLTHKSALSRGVAAPKLQEAYNLYGMPSIEILLEASMSELNDLEKHAIIVYNSIENGFNTLNEAGNPVLFGEAVGTSKYTNDTYLEVLKLLVQDKPTLTKRQIEEITGVSIYTIRHIAALESHTWLKEVEPELYHKLELIKANRYYRGTSYPKLVSPDGSIHEVSHVTNFAREHGLSQPKVTEVLKGTRNHHKGWTRYKE